MHMRLTHTVYGMGDGWFGIYLRAPDTNAREDQRATLRTEPGEGEPGTSQLNVLSRSSYPPLLLAAFSRPSIGARERVTQRLLVR